MTLPTTSRAGSGKTYRPTLKQRIRRTIYFASLVNILLFSVILLIGFSLLFKPLSGFCSSLIAHTIASQMNDTAFLHEYGIDGLAQFAPDDAQEKRWTAALDRSSKLRTYLSTDVIKHMELTPDDGEAAAAGGLPWQRLSDFDIVLLKIELNGHTIYDNEERVSRLPDIGLNKLVSFYTVQSAYPLLDKDGREVGRVAAMIAPQATVALLAAMALLFVVLLFVSLVLSRLIGKLLSIPVLTPLDQLDTKIRAIADGDEEHAMNTTIVLQRPLREIESLAASTNVIMQKMKGYNELLLHQKATLEEQNEELEAQNEELVASETKLQEAQHRLIRSERSVRNLLDNAGQGFLTFGADCLVDEEHSRECAHIFGGDVRHRSFPQLIAPGDAEQAAFLESLLHKIFTEPDRQKQAVYLTLLPEEATIAGRIIQIDYKSIDSTYEDGQTAIMAILTDVTETRELRGRMEEERNLLKTVVKVIVNYGDFSDCLRDYRNYDEFDVPELLSGPAAPKDKLLALYRDIHTYKGNFAQFGLTHVTAHLHDAETRLEPLLRAGDALGDADVRQAAATLQFREWLREDMDVLTSVLGDSFFLQEDLLLVDKLRIVELEKKMVATLSPNECKLLLPELRKLRFKPFKELLRAYPEYVAGLAERSEKFVHPFVIEGDDVMADTEQYYDFSRSLIHLFRNIVDHALESAEERAAAGKDEYGTIGCKLALEGRTLVLSVSDDGSGIDAERIAAKAMERGLVRDEELARMTKEEKLAFIFHDAFSTRDAVTELSGRGIGLSSVRAEVRKLGGTIEVDTAVGQGTTFRIALPFGDADALPDMQFPDMLQPCIGAVRRYFAETLAIPLAADETFAELSFGKLPLLQLSSFITLKGALEGMFVLTMDERLARAVAERLIVGDVVPEEEEALLEDSLAETSNIVLGNSFSMFGPFTDLTMMEPPITIRTPGASMKVAEAQIWTCCMSASCGQLQASFVIMTKGT